MRKLKLLFAGFTLLLGGAAANAYTTDDLASSGWQQVTSLTNVNNYYYVFVDANQRATAMFRNNNSDARPTYNTLANPKENLEEVWVIAQNGDNFNIKGNAESFFFNSGSAGWNDYVGHNNDNGNFTFTLNEGKYDIKSVTANGYIGPWNNDGAVSATLPENIACNKAANQAPGFILYSILRTTFESQLAEARATATSSASDSNPVDVTSYIINSNFTSKNAQGWTRTGSAGNQQWGQQTMESWNANGVVVKQEIRGIPNGKYRVTGDVISGPGATKAAYVFGTGSAKVASSVVSTEASANNYTTMSNEVAGKTLTADNIVVTNNTITIGVDQSTGWIVVDNFKLYYLGEDLSIYVDAYNEAVTAANNVDQNAPMLGTVLSALQSAISTYGTGVDTSDKDALLAATSALTTATNNATTSIAAYAVAKTAIDKANAIKEAHNFASTTATTTFAEAIAAISDAYAAGTLSNADANAAGTTLGTSVSGHRGNPNGAAVNYMENGFGLNDFDAALYVNTWSIEGDNDGSGFSVPFYEYWTGDANSLGKNTFTGTLSDLPNGQYKISAWVRVRAKNETAATDATGITMDVNGGGEGEYAAADVTEGTQIGTSQFQLATYEALGLVKNGMLYLNFNIADGNNISWLSIKNIKYTKVRDLTAEESFTAPTGIELDKTSVSLKTGEVVTLVATVTPDEADDKTVSWTSSDENVATVDANGVVTTVNAGIATITATAKFGNNVTATCTITVADAIAPTFYSTEIANGTDYYIMNAATGKFLGGANDWGTHASIIEHGIPFTVSISDGKYTLDSHTYNNANDHNFNGTYIDNGATNNLYIVALDNGKYSISTADGSAFVTAWGNSTNVTNEAANANSSLAQWYFISKNDRDKMLAAATNDNPVDATYYIKEANISRNLRVSYGKSGWTNISYGEDKNQENSNFNAQVWNASVDVYQKITNIPNGTYTLYMQGFSSGTDVKLYANSVEVPVLAKPDDISSQSVASTHFAAKEYTNTLSVTVTDRTLKIGLKGDCSGSKWLCYDNFELYMTGYTAVENISAELDQTEITEGNTATISNIATDPATASFNAYTISSDNEEVATVTNEGVISAIKVGTANITISAEMENVTKVFKISVVEPVATPESIALKNGEEAAVSMILHGSTLTATLTANVLPADAPQSVEWVSSDENVATVANGVITAVSTGEATITAKSTEDEDISASINVKVYMFKNNSFEADGNQAAGNGTNPKIITITGWTQEQNTAGSYQDNQLRNANTDNSSNYGKRVTPSDGNYYFFYRHGWNGSNYAKLTSETQTLPIGKYTLTVDYKMVSGSDNTTNNDNTAITLSVISGENTLATSTKNDATKANNNSATEYLKNEAWKTISTSFTIEEATSVQAVINMLACGPKRSDFVIDNVTLTWSSFKKALKDAIDVAETVDMTTNVGELAFQIPSSAVSTFNSAISDAQAVYDNAEATEFNYLNAINVLNEAKAAYANAELNAPDTEKLYNIVVSTSGHAKENNPIIIIPGATSANNPTGYALNANIEANENLSQAFTFTKVDGNNYKISAKIGGVDVYLTNGSLNGSPAGWANSQIQATTDSEKAMAFKIAVSTTEGSFNIYNTVTNSTIACQNSGNIYTESGNADFTVAEVSKPSITINTTAAGWGTTILPFAVASLPEGVKAYTCEAVDGAILTLNEVDALAPNKPYIIEGAWNEVLTGDAQGTTLTYSEGLLTGVYSATAAPADSYVLQNNDDKVAFYRVASGEEPTVGANRCYLTVSNSARDAFFFGEETTAIQSIEALTSGDAVIYNAAGARIPTLQKGMNIIHSNGKIHKVIVK